MELLLALGIIGIVSAMGLTITKRTAQSAYNLYFYTGYENLYNALMDARTHGKTTQNDVLNHVNELLGTRDNPEVLGVDLSESLAAGNNRLVRTSNGISYIFTTLPNIPTTISIQMRVPQPKTRSNKGYATVWLLYMNESGYLVPINSNTINVMGLSFQFSNYVDITDRMDLLPAYVDDGFIGRQFGSERITAGDQNIRYMTLREAVCATLPAGTNGIALTTITNCGSIPRRQGAIKFANPRKIR